MLTPIGFHWPRCTFHTTHLFFSGASRLRSRVDSLLLPPGDAIEQLLVVGIVIRGRFIDFVFVDRLRLRLMIDNAGR